MRRIVHWRDIGYPEADLTGVGYFHNDRGEHRGQWVVRKAIPWLFAGTDLRKGSRFSSGGIEADRVYPTSPASTQVVAEIPNLFGPGMTAQMTYYERGGAKVFAAGRSPSPARCGTGTCGTSSRTSGIGSRTIGTRGGTVSSLRRTSNSYGRSSTGPAGDQEASGGGRTDDVRYPSSERPPRPRGPREEERMIRFRSDVEGLRAVAVLLVVLDHLEAPGFHGGFFGVDVFFVISGYLITSLLAAEYAKKAEAHGGRGSISIAGFYARRARRILPAALTVILAVVVAGGVLLNELRVAQIRHDALWAVFFGSNMNFIQQATDYFGQGFVDTSPFQHYWSLAVEEQFYLVWPALFLLVARPHLLRCGCALARQGCHGRRHRRRRVARMVDRRDGARAGGRVLLDVHARMGIALGRADRDRDDKRDAAPAPARPGGVRGRRCVVRCCLRGHRRYDALSRRRGPPSDDCDRAAHRRRPHRPGSAPEPGALPRTAALPRPHLVFRLPVALAARRLRSRPLPDDERDS